MPPASTVHLVDASPYIFRAYFSIPGTLTSPDGAQVNAVYGFATFLLKLAADEAPTHAAVTFDESLTTSFRNEVFPTYKAQRTLPPAQLEAQLKACQEMAAALGFATFVSHRYEADDIIATLCRRLVADGHGAVIVTCDKDLSQLVTERVRVHDPAKGTRLGPAEVLEKMGVVPERVPDLLGLMGDSVDNIPGVRGIGPKTAVTLLRRFGSLEELYAQVDATGGVLPGISASVVSRLRTDRENAFLSKQLATVSFEAPVEASLRDLEWRGPVRDLVIPLCERLGFTTLAARLRR